VSDVYLCECNQAECRHLLHFELLEIVKVRSRYPTPEHALVAAGHENGEPVVLAGQNVAGEDYRVVVANPNPRRTDA
jgi:hypothetical protein